jgi:hypothetical protein
MRRMMGIGGQHPAKFKHDRDLALQAKANAADTAAAPAA